MSKPTAPTFVKDLPPKTSAGAASNGYYDALTANEGMWAEYPGQPHSVYALVRSTRRPGFLFECAIRDGKGYMRAVRA